MATTLKPHEEALTYFKPHIPRFAAAMRQHAPELLLSVHAATQNGEVPITRLKKIGAKVIGLEKGKAAELLREANNPTNSANRHALALPFLEQELGLKPPQATTPPIAPPSTDKQPERPAIARKPPFNLADLFSLSRTRRVVNRLPGDELLPMQQLFFSQMGYAPQEHKGHGYTVSRINPAWLKKNYYLAVTEGKTTLEPIMILRHPQKDAKGKSVMLIIPHGKRPSLSPFKALKGQGVGLDGFTIDVDDPLYLATAKKMAKAISRLSKKTVRIQHTAWREYGKK